MYKAVVGLFKMKKFFSLGVYFPVCCAIVALKYDAYLTYLSVE